MSLSVVFGFGLNGKKARAAGDGRRAARGKGGGRELR